MGTIEIAGAVLGVINVVLIIRRSLWNYPFGIAMVILYCAVFFQARLYSDAALQVFFLVVQVYGWWNWTRARDESGRVPIGWMMPAQRALWGSVATAGTIADGWFLSRYTLDAAPWPDAFTTVFSIVAQYLLSTRRIESWILWIAVDIVSIGLYFSRGLMPTASLYGLFLLLASAGLIQWRREARRHFT